MAATTAIQWTDATFNPWWGCARVSEACQHCYAEALAKRFGQDVWGKTAERRTFGDHHWNEPLRWNGKAETAGVPRLVFCASMADVFEDHPALPTERTRLWELIGRTPWLTWQLLTKRPENIMAMVPACWQDDWPANVWAGTTIETPKRADERLPHLAAVPAPVLFVSGEPLFGRLDLTPWFARGLNWVIAGGESGGKAQPSHPDWFRSLRDQCQVAGVPFLFKQWGEWAPIIDPRMLDVRRGDIVFDDDGKEWTASMRRVGKKAAGRVLDGRTWDEMPGRRAG